MGDFFIWVLILAIFYMIINSIRPKEKPPEPEKKEPAPKKSDDSEYTKSFRDKIATEMIKGKSADDIKISFIIWDCFIDITVFESSSAGLLSTLDIVKTAGCESSLIHLQFKQSQSSLLSFLQFKSRAISLDKVYWASKSLP